MIALEVSINGRRACLAGAEDLFVLNVVLSIGGKLADGTATPRPAPEVSAPYFHVGGVTRSQGEESHHLRWADGLKVAIGDVVSLRLVQVDSGAVDLPNTKQASTGDLGRRNFEFVKAKYLRLKQKYEPEGP